MWKAMGVPVVRPWNTPERMRTVSDSLRLVAVAPCPGLRRSSSRCRSSSLRGRPAGQPSSTPPRPGPWDSPYEVRRRMRPKELPAISRLRAAGLDAGQAQDDGQDAGHGQQHAVPVVDGDLQRRDLGQGTGQQQLGGPGDQALEDTGKDVQKAGAAARVDAVLEGDLAGQAAGEDDGHGVVGPARRRARPSTRASSQAMPPW